MTKRGRLSDEEMDFIGDNLNETNEFIADKLNRLPDTIAKYKTQIVNKSATEPVLREQKTKYEEAKLILQSKPNWEDIKQQYTENEIKLVEYHWSMLYQQFKEDMTHTEELQIFKLINLEVMIDRNMKEKAKSDREIERIEKDLKKLYEKEQRTSTQQEKLMFNEAELKYARASQQARNNEYTKLLEKHDTTLKGLKATRAERFKDTESSNETFFGIVKALTNDASFRDRVSQNMELFRMGAEKEAQRFSQPHKYLDGDVDYPIMTPELMETLDKE